jgi:cysteinyl-tRNA synthetase, unknown class
VYLPSLDRDAVRQLDAWSGAGRKAGRANFFVGTLDYVPTCSATTVAAADWDYSKQAGFSPSVSTVDLASVCWWPFLANKAG